jgi:hypothetical protein
MRRHLRLGALACLVAAGIATLAGEDVMSSLFGTMTPFPPARLRALYRSRAIYLDAYDEAVDQAVEAGYVLDRDAESIKQTAAANAADLLPG